MTTRFYFISLPCAVRCSSSDILKPSCGCCVLLALRCAAAELSNQVVGRCNILEAGRAKQRCLQSLQLHNGQGNPFLADNQSTEEQRVWQGIQQALVSIFDPLELTNRLKQTRARGQVSNTKHRYFCGPFCTTGVQKKHAETRVLDRNNQRNTWDNREELPQQKIRLLKAPLQHFVVSCSSE